MTRQSAEIIAREMGGTVFMPYDDDYGVEIRVNEVRRVEITEEMIEAFDKDKVQNRIWLKPRPLD